MAQEESKSPCPICGTLNHTNRVICWACSGDLRGGGENSPGESQSAFPAPRSPQYQVISADGQQMSEPMDVGQLRTLAEQALGTKVVNTTKKAASQNIAKLEALTSNRKTTAKERHSMAEVSSGKGADLCAVLCIIGGASLTYLAMSFDVGASTQLSSAQRDAQAALGVSLPEKVVNLQLLQTQMLYFHGGATLLIMGVICGIGGSILASLKAIYSRE